MSKSEKSENKKKNNLELSFLPNSFESNLASFYSSFGYPSYPYYQSFGSGLDCYGYFCPYYSYFSSPFSNAFDLYSCDFLNQNESSSCVKITEIKEIVEEKEEKKIEDDAAKLSFNFNFTKDLTFNKEDFEKQVEEIKKEYEKLFLNLNSHITV